LPRSSAAPATDTPDQRLRGLVTLSHAVQDPAVATLLARQTIVDTITTLFIATDARDWDSVRACFTPEVHFDMTSVAGGELRTMTPAAIAAGWEQGLRPIEAVHHQVGNFRIESTLRARTRVRFATASRTTTGDTRRGATRECSSAVTTSACARTQASGGSPASASPPSSSTGTCNWRATPETRHFARARRRGLPLRDGSHRL
jgi:hypothetical protein